MRNHIHVKISITDLQGEVFQAIDELLQTIIDDLTDKIQSLNATIEKTITTDM